LIKGGIFFWIGILAIGRWAGAFSDLGWAWNVKLPVSGWKAKAPSSEFVESALICFYGVTNVWLEHLNAWGEAWSPMDYEHLSITILFFGGGLVRLTYSYTHGFFLLPTNRPIQLGMLIESKRIRNLLNTSLSLLQPSPTPASPMPATPTSPTWAPPHTSTTPTNPIPSLTILLLGLIMSAHTQHSPLAAKIHTLWGYLFAAASLARFGTYLISHLSPPTSFLPSRPPTELLTGFALVAGGFLFMASARDVTDAMEGAGADGMVAFTVGMGVAMVVCAGVVGGLAVKGWAVGREGRSMVEERV
jgi:hypothetical protein